MPVHGARGLTVAHRAHAHPKARLLRAALGRARQMPLLAERQRHHRGLASPVEALFEDSRIDNWTHSPSRVSQLLILGGWLAVGEVCSAAFVVWKLVGYVRMIC